MKDGNPHAIDAERAVLGAFLLDGSLIELTDGELIIGKNRNGPLATFKLRFDKARSLFTEIAETADTAIPGDF